MHEGTHAELGLALSWTDLRQAGMMLLNTGITEITPADV